MDLLAALKRILVTEGPVTKPEVIERVDGAVIEVSPWKTYEKAKEAKVRLNGGAIVSVFVPPGCLVEVGDDINISVLGINDSKERFHVYKTHNHRIEQTR